MSKSASSISVPPNQTLYISNLCDKIRKDDMRLSLYTLFSTYGVVLDVVALKTKKMRGQAHVAFRDVGTATLAMRGCQGMKFFGKELRISYAKSKSDTIAKLDGTYRMPNAKNTDSTTTSGGSFVPLPGQEVKTEPEEKGGDADKMDTDATAKEVAGQKRRRDESDEEDNDVEMEVEDDD